MFSLCRFVLADFEAVIDRRAGKIDGSLVKKIVLLLHANDINLSERKCLTAKDKALKTGGLRYRDRIR